MFDIASNTEFLTEIGINDAPQDIKDKMIAEIEKLAQERLIIKISNRVTEAQAEEFEKVTNGEQAQKWIETNIPDFSNLAEETLQDIKNEILSHKSNVMGG